MSTVTVQEAIKDVMRVAQDMDVTGLTAVILTEAMLQAVFDDINMDYVRPESRRLHLGNYLFVLCDTAEKALVIQPDVLNATLQSLGEGNA